MHRLFLGILLSATLLHAQQPTGEPYFGAEEFFENGDGTLTIHWPWYRLGGKALGFWNGLVRKDGEWVPGPGLSEHFTGMCRLFGKTNVVPGVEVENTTFTYVVGAKIVLDGNGKLLRLSPSAGRDNPAIETLVCR